MINNIKKFEKHVKYNYPLIWESCKVSLFLKKYRQEILKDTKNNVIRIDGICYLPYHDFEDYLK